MGIAIGSGAQAGHLGGGWLSRDAGRSNRIITRPYAQVSSPGGGAAAGWVATGGEATRGAAIQGQLFDSSALAVAFAAM